jgi:hypothetical protein
MTSPQDDATARATLAVAARLIDKLIAWNGRQP